MSKPDPETREAILAYYKARLEQLVKFKDSDVRLRCLLEGRELTERQIELIITHVRKRR